MIKVRLFTLAIDPASGSFPTEPLAQMEEEVLQVSEHFFVHMGMPHLLLIVHYRDRSSRDRYIRNERSVVQDRPARPMADSGVRADLAQPEQEVFDRLRAWRNGRAQSEGVPPYVLLTNRQLAEVVKRQPATIRELREIDGIGEAKAGKLGKELLGMLVLLQKREQQQTSEEDNVADGKVA